MDVYNEEPGCSRHVEDAGVVDALLKAVGEEKNVVAAFPYNAGVTAPGHVAGDENEVAGTVGAVGWEVAKFGQPGRNEGKDEAATVFGGNRGAVVVGAAHVFGVLEGAPLDRDLGDEAVCGGADAG